MKNINDAELNILATAIANLVNTRTLCKVSPDQYQPEKTKYRILCADGKNRRIRRKDLINLLEKLTNLAGHEISEDAKGIIRSAGLW